MAPGVIRTFSGLTLMLLVFIRWFATASHSAGDPWPLVYFVLPSNNSGHSSGDNRFWSWESWFANSPPYDSVRGGLEVRCKSNSEVIKTGCDRGHIG